jgi:hypothetical protein
MEPWASPRTQVHMTALRDGDDVAGTPVVESFDAFDRRALMIAALTRAKRCCALSRRLARSG